MNERKQSRLAKPEVSMSAEFLTESDVVERTQITSGGGTDALSIPEEVIFLRLPKVQALTGLSKSSLYELIRTKSFPAPVQLGPRTVAWVSYEVRQWAAERISTSRSKTSHLGARRMPQRALGKSWGSSKKLA
jgi:prophage regulatory protein